MKNYDTDLFARDDVGQGYKSPRELADLVMDARTRLRVLEAQHERWVIAPLTETALEMARDAEASVAEMRRERDEAVKLKGYADEAAHVYASELDEAWARLAVLEAEVSQLYTGMNDWRDRAKEVEHLVGIERLAEYEHLKLRSSEAEARGAALEAERARLMEAVRELIEMEDLLTFPDSDEFSEAWEAVTDLVSAQSPDACACNDPYCPECHSAVALEALAPAHGAAPKEAE